jgi:O-antigen/teichoic acid export membrane protein
MFAQLGIPTYGIRACAKVRDDKQKLTKTAQELLIINLVMSVVSYLVFFICLLTIPRLQEDRTLYIIVSSNILLTSIGMEWLYKALEQYSYITIRSIIFKFVALIAMFMLVHEQKDYIVYGGISIFAGCASNILNFINVHKYICLKPVGNYNFKPHFKAVGVFFAMACATTIYTHLDTVMLGFMATDDDVGYYSAAVKIKTILVSIVTSLGTVLLPRASYYVEQNKMDEFRKITKKALNFVFLLATPLTIYFMIFAKQGIYFLSGSAYTGAIVPMQVIMPTLVLIGITNILGIQILVPTGREKFVLYSEIIGAVVDLILNAILIPIMQSTGAAIGTLAAEFAVLVVQYIALRKEIKPAFAAIKYYKIIIAIILAIAASLWVNLLQFGSFVTLAISAVCFFAVYGVILIIMKENLVVEIFRQMIDKVVRRRKC